MLQWSMHIKPHFWGRSEFLVKTKVCKAIALLKCPSPNMFCAIDVHHFGLAFDLPNCVPPSIANTTFVAVKADGCCRSIPTFGQQAGPGFSAWALASNVILM